RRREIRGIGRHGEHREERRPVIAKDFQLSRGISRVGVLRYREPFDELSPALYVVAQEHPLDSLGSLGALLPIGSHARHSTNNTWFAENGRIAFLGGFLHLGQPRRRERGPDLVRTVQDLCVVRGQGTEAAGLPQTLFSVR